MCQGSVCQGSVCQGSVCQGSGVGGRGVGGRGAGSRLAGERDAARQRRGHAQPPRRGAEEHLQLLSELAQGFSDPDFRDKLRTSTDAAEVLKLFASN